MHDVVRQRSVTASSYLLVRWLDYLTNTCSVLYSRRNRMMTIQMWSHIRMLTRQPLPCVVSLFICPSQTVDNIIDWHLKETTRSETQYTYSLELASTLNPIPGYQLLRSRPPTVSLSWYTIMPSHIRAALSTSVSFYSFPYRWIQHFLKRDRSIR